MTDTPFKQDADASTGFLLWQVHTIWRRQVAAALRAHDLTQVQFALLASIMWLTREGEEVTQVRVARHAKLDVMMTSQVLRTLESRGLLERQAHPKDTRAKIVVLTPAGVERAMLTIPVVEQVDEAFFKVVDAEKNQFNQMLNALIQSAQEK